MSSAADEGMDPRLPEPWFTQHPELALAVAVACFAVIFTVRLTVAGTADSVTVLYVLPVSLLALAFGFRAGVAAGLLAVALMVVWVLLEGESLSVFDWIGRVVPLLLLGALVGWSSDRIREARRAERYALAVSLLQRDAAEINDSVVQGLAATKWLLESGRVDSAIEALDETATIAQELVSRVLGADSLIPEEFRHSQQVLRSHPSSQTVE